MHQALARRRAACFVGPMQASRRISGLNPDGNDGWGLFLKARRMIAAGENVLELTIGEHDIRTDPRILEAMERSARAGNTGYAPVPGMDMLRDAIAARAEARSGVRTTRANVAVTPGGQAGLFAAHMAALDPGDRALFIDPYYATYPGTIRGVSAVPVPVQARPEDGFQPRAGEIARAADASGARSLLINSPNNPTGAVYSPATLTEIAKVVADRGMWLISDEVYDSQVWQGEHICARGLPGMADQALVVGSMSKSHAMTGSRLGWVIGPQEAIAGIHALSTNTTYGVAGFVQEAGLFALSLGQAFEEEIAAPFRTRRNMLIDRLAAQQVLGAAPPDGAMYVMVDVRGTGLDGEGFAQALLREEKIAVMPGGSFGTAASGHVRVALTLPDQAFGEAIDRMIAFTARVAG